MTGAPIDLAAWLDRLGFESGEWLQFCTQTKGGPFQAVALSKAPANMPADRDVWVGPNPVQHFTTGRPSAEHITRLAALHIDLDVKPGGCPSFDVARTIVDDLSGMLGTRPVAVTYSGHGMQPVWAVECGSISDFVERPGGIVISRAEARSLLRRWGRLVAAVAEKRGAKVDSLYDLTRVLRAPGGVNHKAAPVPVHAFGDTGGPVDVERILEALEEYGVHETAGDQRDPGAVISAPADWSYSINTCGYAATMARQWATDTPTSRHGWLGAQAVRIHAAHRYGCLDEAGKQLLAAQLVARFHQLIAGGKVRESQAGEIADFFQWGQQCAAAMTDNHLASELGYHLHAEPLVAPEGPSNADRTGLAVNDVPAGVRDPEQWDTRPETHHEESAASVPDARVTQADDPFDLDERLDDGPSNTLSASEAAVNQADRAADVRPADDYAGQADPAMRTGLPSVPGMDAASEGRPTLTPEQVAWAAKVEQEALHLRVRDEAKELEQVRKAGAFVIPPLVGLGAFLSVTDEPVEFRVDGLWPMAGRILWAAQFKAGKTTGVGNLTRALVDGVPFLDAFPVAVPVGRVVLIDDEMSEGQLRRWLRSQGISNTAAVSLVALRGQVGTFDIINPAVRKQWADNLRAANCDVLIFDCLRPVLDALGLDENKDAGKFLVAFDALLAEAGIHEAAVIHHMGHGGERSRGDSRLRDWPDVEWRLVRDVPAGEEDPAAPRYFSAFGRDVSVPEGLLTMDEESRRLSYDPEQTRAEAKTQRKAKSGPIDAGPDLLAYLAVCATPLSGRQIEVTMNGRGHTVQGVRRALQAARDRGDIVTTTGPRGAFLHSLNPEGVSSEGQNRVRDASATPVAHSSRVVRDAPYVVGAAHSLRRTEKSDDPFDLGSAVGW